MQITNEQNATPQKQKRKARDYDTHIFHRVDYLLETAKHHELAWGEVVGKLKKEPWDCPMGWIRSHYVEGLEDGWDKPMENEGQLPH